MPLLKIYDQLLQFPLFQGLGRDDLAQVAGHTKFGFQKVSAGQTVAAVDSPCTQLFFLLSGILRAETFSDDRAYSVVEEVTAPFLFQPDAIFGYHQRFTHTFKARTACSFITLDKTEVMRLSEQFLVFRLNLLNIFATHSQKLQQQLWHRYPETLTVRIARFLVCRCLYPAGSKTFNILMTRLADEVGDSRLDVSRALNLMQREGLLPLNRGRIVVPQLERLSMQNVKPVLAGVK